MKKGALTGLVDAEGTEIKVGDKLVDYLGQVYEVNGYQQAVPECEGGTAVPLSKLLKDIDLYLVPEEGMAGHRTTTGQAKPEEEPEPDVELAPEQEEYVNEDPEQEEAPADGFRDDDVTDSAHIFAPYSNADLVAELRRRGVDVTAREVEIVKVYHDL